MNTGLSLRERLAEFYAYETALLDDDQLHEWLDLMDDDVRYVMPMRETRQGKPSTNPNPTFYLYNDDKESLKSRVARFDTGLALVESPPSATQRLVSDILVLETAPDAIITIDARGSVAGFALSRHPPALGDHREPVCRLADPAQHHRHVRLGGQRAVLEKVHPIRPLPLRQQQHPAPILLAQPHLLADLAEHAQLVPDEVIHRAPRHAW